jgi:hypothetical protein
LQSQTTAAQQITDADLIGAAAEAASPPTAEDASSSTSSSSSSTGGSPEPVAAPPPPVGDFTALPFVGEPVQAWSGRRAGDVVPGKFIVTLSEGSNVTAADALEGCGLFARACAHSTL